MIVPVRYQVLGPLEAGSENIVALGGPKQRLVLAVLLIRLGGVVSDDRLVDELWPEEAPNGARHAIQTYISELRRALDDEIVRVGSGYRLKADPQTVDAHRFETLVAAGRERMRDAPASAAALFREALGLWHGDPYGGVADSSLLRAETHRLIELRVAAMEDRVAADLDAGRHAEVATELEALTREYPFRERFHALRMLALYRCDRQADALRAFQHARRWLDDELGLDPSTELQELQRRILNQDPALRPVAMVGTGERSALGEANGGEIALLRGFELRERVGEGARASTYRAYQASTGREVAVRLYADNLRRSPAFVRFFDATARRVATLEHPNVVPLLDWWRDAGEACVISPWMRRGSLEAALGQEAWSLSATLRLAEQVGGALSAAHRGEVLHGNLHARNVLLDADGNAMVSDFGLAPGDSAGSRSPAPRDAEPPSVRADIRSLAILLIAALTGRTANGDNPVLALAQLRSDLPADLVAVLAQATSAVSSDRHERVDDLIRDLRQASGADVVAPARAAERPDRVRNPYKGLQAFHEADAPDFFGREALLDRLSQSVAAHRLVVVAGASGSGKSSLVRAGLLPVIRAHPPPGADEWVVAEMFPGAFPFEELERALLRAGSVRPDDLYAHLTAGEKGLSSVLPEMLQNGLGLLLLVDQLEEAWSLTEDADTRRLFLDNLVTAASDPGSRIRIVATLRADFLDRAMETHALAEMTRQGLALVTPPSPQELAAAVSMPAQQVGLHFQAGLVDRIVRDVEDEPGALPLLQHALSELVATREGDRVTTARYEAIGGVAGALGRRAEAVFGDLTREGRVVARQVFLRLVTVDEQRDDARRRVRRTELGALTPNATVIDEVLRQFGAHRLLTFDRDPVTRGPTVEVAHEALFSEWKRLREWIDTRRTDLLLHRRLRQSTQEWLAADHSPDYLLGGGRLDEAEAWGAATDLALSGDERALLAASREREDRARVARARRRRFTLAGVTIVAVMALALATFASLQAGRAEAGERRARARALAAASMTQLDRDEDLALLLALDAVRVSTDAGEPPLREAVDALHAATIADRTVTVVKGGLFVGFTAAGEGVTLGGTNGAAFVWDAASGETLADLAIPELGAGDAEVSPSGALAAGTFGNPVDGHPQSDTIWIWDLAERTVMERIREPGLHAVRPAFSLDDRLLAYIVDDFHGPLHVQVRQVRGGASVSRFAVNGWRRLAFGADGAWLAVTNDDAPVADLYDPTTGELLRSVGDPRSGGYLYDMAADQAGERLALYLQDPLRIELYDATTGVLLREIPVTDRPGRICFLADGSGIVAQGADEMVHLWNVNSGAEILKLPGSSLISGLACSHEGARVAVVTSEESTTVYDVAASAPSEIASAPLVQGGYGTWTSSGDLFVAEGGAKLKRFDANGALLAEATQAVIALEPGWVPVSPDGTLVAATTPGDGSTLLGPIALFDAESLRTVRVLDTNGRVPLAFSPDGDLLLTGGEVGGAIYDVQTGAQLSALLPQASGAFAMPSGEFLPGGRQVVLKPAGLREAWIYDVADGSLAGTVCSRLPSNRVAVDPAEQRLYIADLPDFIEHWDLDRLVEAVANSGPTCGPDGSNPSDRHRELVAALPGAGGIAFSPDGRWLASTAGYQGTLIISDPATGERAFAISHDAEISILGFSPDSRELAIAYRDTRGSQDALRIYAVYTDDLVTLARQKLTRNLTRADCEAFPEAISCPST